MIKIAVTLSQTWLNLQSSLFLWLSEELDTLTNKQQELVTPAIQPAIEAREKPLKMEPISFSDK